MPTTRKRIFKSGLADGKTETEAKTFAASATLAEAFGLGDGPQRANAKVIRIEVEPLPHHPLPDAWRFSIIVEGDKEAFRNVRNDRVGLSAEWKKYLHPEEEE